MTFQEAPKNFDPNSIPVAEDSIDDLEAQVKQWFQEQAGQGQDDGSGDPIPEGVGTGDASAPVPPPPPAATAQDADNPDPFANMDHQAKLAYAQFLAWASQDPTRLEALDKFWRGEAQLTTGSQAAAPTSTPTAVPAPAASEPQSGSSLPAPIKEMQEKLEAVTTVTKHVYQDYQQRQAAEVKAAYDNTVNEVKQQYGLSDEQMAKLVNAASATNLAKPLTDQHGLSMGMRKLFETTMAMEPEFRQVLIQRDQQRNRQQQERAKKQGALVGSSGSVTRSPAAPPQTGRGTRLTNPERTAGMAAMIAAAQGATE